MQQQFNGLTMPVFAAFGWAGEETALKFALSQLEQFIQVLHANLSRRAQNNLPFFGIDRESQSVYLAANQDVDEGPYLVFNARPMSLELQLIITDQMALSVALKAADGRPEKWRSLLHDLGPDWTLQIKQMEVDEESGQRTSYQELFKGGVTEMSEEDAESVSSRASFLNGEPQWVTPLYLGRRFDSEQIAVMGTKVIDVMAKQVELLQPILEFMTVRAQPKRTKAKKQAVKVAKPQVTTDPDRQFVYVAELKPLHLRRGFINLTPEHWDFFARTARATTRSITVAYEDHLDKESSVWHLASNNMARIVLSDPVREWLEETFAPEDQVQVTATKLDDEEIEVALESVG